MQDLRSQLMDKASVQSSNSGDDQLSWIDTLAAEINENVEERINLQKALFELEDLNVCNKFELKQLDEYIESGQTQTTIAWQSTGKDPLGDIFTPIFQL